MLLNSSHERLHGCSVVMPPSGVQSFTFKILAIVLQQPANVDQEQVPKTLSYSMHKHRFSVGVQSGSLEIIVALVCSKQSPAFFPPP